MQPAGQRATRAESVRISLKMRAGLHQRTVSFPLFLNHEVHPREPFGSRAPLAPDRLAYSRKMEAELIVVSGAHLGARFPLGKQDVSIGRAASAGIRLAETGVAPEHCVVRPSPTGYRLSDRRSPSGTYINGMRVTEQALEPGDQVAIGDAILLYREGPVPERGNSSERQSLLRACSFLFLFRAIAGAREQTQRAAFEAPMRTLLAEIVPCTAARSFSVRTKTNCGSEL
jgi:Inner membrane component of T3SS, cytoplasmic domain